MSASTDHSSTLIHPNNFLRGINERIHGQHVDEHPLIAKVHAMIMIIIGVGLLYASLPLSLSIGSIAFAVVGSILIAKSIALITLIVQRAFWPKAAEVQEIEMGPVPQTRPLPANDRQPAPTRVALSVAEQLREQLRVKEQLRDIKGHMGEVPRLFLRGFREAIEKLPEDPATRFDLWRNLYDGEDYAPPGDIFEYIAGGLFAPDCADVRVYYNPDKMTQGDALRHLAQREPISVGTCGDDGKPITFKGQELTKAFAYKESVHREPYVARERDGRTWSEDPSVACVYTPTCITKKSVVQPLRIGVLSVAAPALDKLQQPDFTYYTTGQVREEDKSLAFFQTLEKGILDRKKYEEAMRFLSKVVVQCFMENKNKRGRVSFRRLVLTRYGQANFLKAIQKEDQPIAHAIFYQSLVNEFISQAKAYPDLLKSPIVMSEYSNRFDEEMQQQFVDPLKAAGFANVDIINGDILENVQGGDLIVNPWDPHGAYGNGDKGDRPFNGFIESATTALATTLPWINTLLLWKKELFVPIGSQEEKDPFAAAGSSQS